MTTEAEEFNMEEKRAEYLSNKFSQIWCPLREFNLFVDIHNDPNGSLKSPDHTWDGRYFATFRDWDGNELLYEDKTQYFITELAALRALNDRLELALQGKVKGE